MREPDGPHLPPPGFRRHHLLDARTVASFPYQAGPSPIRRNDERISAVHLLGFKVADLAQREAVDLNVIEQREAMVDRSAGRPSEEGRELWISAGSVVVDGHWPALGRGSDRRARHERTPVPVGHPFTTSLTTRRSRPTPRTASQQPEHIIRDDGRVRLNHVALTVSDRDRSAAFYGRHFRLIDRVHEDEHLLILGSADGSLLALTEGQVPTDLPRSNHFGFRMMDGDAVRRARQQLRDAGATETEWQDDGRFVRVQVADPDGYRVELFAY